MTIHDAPDTQGPPDADACAAAILELLARRRPEASICPSEVARLLAKPDVPWRSLMPTVREAASALARGGRLRITQGDRVLSAAGPLAGPIRLRRP